MIKYDVQRGNRKLTEYIEDEKKRELIQEYLEVEEDDVKER